MSILRNQNEVVGASSADLVETYNALTGKSIKKFENRSLAETRVAAAIMSAENAAGHAGVAKGAEPVAKTKAELKAEKARKADPREQLKKAHFPEVPKSIKETQETEFTPDDTCEETENPYKPGTLSFQLWEACKAAKVAEPERKLKVKSESKEKAVRAPKYTYVVATGEGTSKLQEASSRAKILAFINKHPKGTQVSIEAISKHMGIDARGPLKKMLDRNHISPVVLAEEKAEEVSSEA